MLVLFFTTTKILHSYYVVGLSSLVLSINTIASYAITCIKFLLNNHSECSSNYSLAQANYIDLGNSCPTSFQTRGLMVPIRKGFLCGASIFQPILIILFFVLIFLIKLSLCSMLTAFYMSPIIFKK